MYAFSQEMTIPSDLTQHLPLLQTTERKTVFFLVQFEYFRPFPLTMHKFRLLFVLILLYSHAFTQEQEKRSIRIIVLDEQKNALPGSTVYLLNYDSVVVHSGAADASGTIEFKELKAGKYRLRTSRTGYTDGFSAWVDLEKNTSFSDVITLKPQNGLMKEVLVVSKKPSIQFLPDKT